MKLGRVFVGIILKKGDNVTGRGTDEMEGGGGGGKKLPREL
jgi:hypothetical protein